MRSYRDVLTRISHFDDGADATALQANFVAEADKGRYDFDLIERVRGEIAGHVRVSLDRGHTRLGSRLRITITDEGREALAGGGA